MHQMASTYVSIGKSTMLRQPVFPLWEKKSSWALLDKDKVL